MNKIDPKRKRHTSVVLAVAALSFFLYASSTGITGVTQKNGDGCKCHGGQNAGVNVTINGPATLAAGATGDYAVTIQGGPLSRAGTNIAVSAGTLSVIAGEGTKLVGGEITHTGPKTPVSGVVTFSFKYTAPATAGAITMYANGNSVNFNGNNSGDQWNFAPNKTIDVVTGIEDDVTINGYALGQNYPNPFNPSTTISFAVKNAADITIALYDVTGKQVAVLAEGFYDAGTHSINLNTAEYGLSSGVYFYKMQAGSFISVKKLVLTK